jgi:hypothetical protein
MKASVLQGLAEGSGTEAPGNSGAATVALDRLNEAFPDPAECPNDLLGEVPVDLSEEAEEAEEALSGNPAAEGDVSPAGAAPEAVVLGDARGRTKRPAEVKPLRAFCVHLLPCFPITKVIS